MCIYIYKSLSIYKYALCRLLYTHTHLTHIFIFKFQVYIFIFEICIHIYAYIFHMTHPNSFGNSVSEISDFIIKLIWKERGTYELN